MLWRIFRSCYARSASCSIACFGSVEAASLFCPLSLWKMLFPILLQYGPIGMKHMRLTVGNHFFAGLYPLGWISYYRPCALTYQPHWTPLAMARGFLTNQPFSQRKKSDPPPACHPAATWRYANRPLHFPAFSSSLPASLPPCSLWFWAGILRRAASPFSAVFWQLLRRPVAACLSSSFFGGF